MLKDMITTKNDAVDRFMSFALHRHVQVQKVLNNKWSETTHSTYTILRDHTGQIYELALSSHPGANHRYPIREFLQGHTDLPTLRMSMKQRGITMPPGSHILSGHSYYSINYCRPYRMNPRDLIGRYSSHLAFMTDCYEVKDALLVDDKQVLALTYTDPHHKKERQAIYVNYDPIKRGCSERDIVAIHYLIQHYDIQVARRIYYHDDYRLMTEATYRADEALRLTGSGPNGHTISHHQYQALARMSEAPDNGMATFVDRGVTYVWWLTNDRAQYARD